MRNVLDTSCGHNRGHILFAITFSKNRAVYEKMKKNVVQPDRPQMTIQYGACATHAG